MARKMQTKPVLIAAELTVADAKEILVQLTLTVLADTAKQVSV
jgi:hypothetical protein